MDCPDVDVQDVGDLGGTGGAVEAQHHQVHDSGLFQGADIVAAGGFLCKDNYLADRAKPFIILWSSKSNIQLLSGFARDRHFKRIFS